MSRMVRITTDSACDLSPELCDQYGVKTIPLYITMSDGSSLRDGIEVSPQDIFKSARLLGEIPKTSAPNVQDYLNFFEPMIKEGCEIVHLSLNSGFSATYHNAVLAADLLGHVRVVDSRTLSSALGLLVLKAAEFAADGLIADTIFDRMMELRRKTSTTFMLDTLEFAVKGGRCSSLTAFGANLLHIKPMMAVDHEGGIRVARKFRGTFTATVLDYAKHALSTPNIDPSRLFLTYTSLPDKSFELLMRFIQDAQLFDQVIPVSAGCTICTHGGPNTVGLFYMTK